MVYDNGHSPTDTSVRLGVTVMLRPWPLAKAHGYILVWESLTDIIIYLSSPPQVLLLLFPRVGLESGGLNVVMFASACQSLSFKDPRETWDLLRR
jgi:hypothetical protein